MDYFAAIFGNELRFEIHDYRAPIPKGTPMVSHFVTSTFLADGFIVNHDGLVDLYLMFAQQNAGDIVGRHIIIPEQSISKMNPAVRSEKLQKFEEHFSRFFEILSDYVMH